MKPKLKLPSGLGPLVRPTKIDPDNIIKAESHCLIWIEQLADGTLVVAKMYHHRGLANFVRGSLLNFRAQREHRILQHLTGCGISCSEPQKHHEGQSAFICNNYEAKSILAWNGFFHLVKFFRRQCQTGS